MTRFALPLLAFLPLVAVVPGLAPACDMMSYARVQASPHVTVFQAAEGTTGVVNGNMVLVTGRDAQLLVDTGQIPSVARRVLAEVRAISPAPLRHIVNTHWHGDHLLGNFVFREAFPAARIIAHPHTIAEGARAYTDYGTRMAERIQKVVDGMRKQRDEAASEAQKRFLSRTIDCADRLLPEVPGTRYLPPDTPFERDLAIDLGGVTAVVRHVGPGNTPGDLVVWVKEDRLLATGDMVVHPAPYAIGSDLAPWVGTLAKLRAMEPAVIVPGHGPVMRDDAYVRDLEALFADTDRQLAALKKAGVSRAAAPGRLDTRAFAARHLDTPMKREAFDQFFVRAAVARAFPAPPPAPEAVGKRQGRVLSRAAPRDGGGGRP